jgi:hypothetical protein
MCLQSRHQYMTLLVREIEWFGELLLIAGVISLDLIVGTVRCDDPDDLGAVQCCIGGFALVPVCTLQTLSDVASGKVHSWDLPSSNGSNNASWTSLPHFSNSSRKTMHRLPLLVQRKLFIKDPFQDPMYGAFGPNRSVLWTISVQSILQSGNDRRDPICFASSVFPCPLGPSIVNGDTSARVLTTHQQKRV